MRTLTAIAALMLMLAGCVSDEPVDAGDDDAPDPLQDAMGTENATMPAWGDLASATIRPGASLGGYCTFNFLFYGMNGSAYIGTAGHCTEEIGERVSLGDGDEIGTVVYDSDLIDHGSDFSLMLLDVDQLHNSHPQMFRYNGPTGAIPASDLSAGDIIQLYGYGLLLGDNEESRARQGALVSWTDDEYDVDMPAVNGDSGSPLLHANGQAFGIVSRYGAADGVPSTDSGPLMSYVFAGLAEAGYGDVVLATI
jgi:hypothetical protein